MVNICDDYGNLSCFISENGIGVENENRFLSEEGMVRDRDDYQGLLVQASI
ncbi:hypothetical protein [Enterococcus sp. DIV0086]|uniref:hypothetical protein n=1 Tax=Enterococcus sp. DIV0086 TaxID=2774655 RepID=UPI003D2A288F